MSLGRFNTFQYVVFRVFIGSFRKGSGARFFLLVIASVVSEVHVIASGWGLVFRRTPSWCEFWQRARLEHRARARGTARDARR